MRASVALIALCLLAMPQRAFADANPSLTITESGVVRREPDVATLQIGIVTNDDDANASSARNSAVTEAVTQRLVALGLPAESVRTYHYNVDFVPRPAQTPPPSSRVQRYGYVAYRQLNATRVPLAALGRAFDAALAAGATGISVGEYDVIDRESVEAEAVAAAIRSARRDADRIAKTSNQHVLSARSVVVGTQLGLRFIGRVSASSDNRFETIERPSTRIAPEPIEIQQTVTVTFDVR